jgi:hypothetical protein
MTWVAALYSYYYVVGGGTQASKEISITHVIRGTCTSPHDRATRTSSGDVQPMFTEQIENQGELIHHIG